MRGSLQIKKFILNCITGLFILLQFLFAAGTYDYGDITPINATHNVKLHAFNASQQDKQLFTKTQEFMYTTSFGEDMAYVSGNNAIGNPANTENELAVLAGYSAYSLNDPKSLFFDVFPGTSNAVQKTARISFKAWTTESLVNGLTTYNNGIDPRTVMVQIKRKGQTFVFQANPNNQNTIAISNPDPSKFFVMNPYYYDGQGVAYEIGFKDGLELGEVVEVVMTAIYTKDYKYADQKQASTMFTFKVAGVPFLEKIVKEHTESYNPLTDNNDQKVYDPALYGWSMAGGGDINGDGFDDYVVSDPYFLYSTTFGYEQARSGIVYIYYGGPQHDDIADVVLENRLDYGADADKYACREFGYHVELGDINGDGYADIIVGQPSYGNTANATTGGINSGRILIYYGGPSLIDGGSSVDWRKPSLIVANSSGKGGTETPDLFGDKFAVGDLNKDGYADIIGKCGQKAYFIDGSKLYGELPNPAVKKYPVTKELTSVLPTGSNGPFKSGLYTNSDLAIIGDVNNDGYKDFAVSFPSGQKDQSLVEVYFGGTSWTSMANIRSVLKDRSDYNQHFGYTVAPAGDVNNDGFDDILVGNKTDKRITGHYGRVVVFLGQPTGSFPLTYQYGGSEHHVGSFMISDPFKTTNIRDYPQFGMVATGVGDVDGDNYDDFMIGAPDFGRSGIGAVYVFLGSPYINVSDFTPDRLSSYIIVGDYANAHLGRTLVRVGDIDADGYEDPAIASLGYVLGFQVRAYDSAEFTGYPEKLIQTITHNISVYANLNAVDQAAPVLLSSQPYFSSVGWEPDGTMQFLVADRGNAGLEFDTLGVAFRKKGMNKNKNEYILQPRTFFSNDYGNLYSSVLKDFELVDFWTMEESVVSGDRQIFYRNIYDPAVSNNITTMWRNAGYEAVRVLEGGYPAYKYNKKARIVGLKIKPKPTFIANEKLKYSEDYVLDVEVRDRAGSPFELYGGTKNLTTVPFSTRQEQLSIVGTSNYVFQNGPSIHPGPSHNQFIAIGNFNGDPDGLTDFAYANPEYTDRYGNKAGAIFIYWGSPAIDFTNPPDLIITPRNSSFAGDPGTLHFGKFLSSLNTDDSISPAELIVGFDGLDYLTGKETSNGGFYVLKGDNQGTFYTNVHDDTTTIVDIMRLERHPEFAQRVNMVSKPLVATPIKTKSGKKEMLAVGNASKQVFVYKTHSGAFEVNPTPDSQASKTFDTPVKSLSGGFFDGGDVQQLAVGLPFHKESDNKLYGKVEIFKVASGNGYLTAAKTISNTSEGALCGFSLSSGYFDDELKDDNKDGSYDNLSQVYEDLAVGYPFDSVFAPEAGKVVIFKGSSTGLRGTTSETMSSPNIMVLKPESSYDHFGYDLATAKYLSTPPHYKNWSISTTHRYFDDADDLLVGAPGYNVSLNAKALTGYGLPDHQNSEGKMYVFIGGPDVDTIADAGIVGKQPGDNIGKTVAAAGDLLDNRADLIMAGGANRYVPILINKSIPDTSPPYIEAIIPADRTYDVNRTANISIEVSDISGIRRDQLNVYRVIEGTPNYLVQAGLGSNRVDVSWDDFTLSEEVLKLDGSRKRYTLALKPTYRSPYFPKSDLGYWAESETVDLIFTVGDDRYVWAGSGKNMYRIENPLTRKISSGFVVQFKENEMTPIEFRGTETYNSYFSSSMASVGDVNADGYEDFMVGEYGNNQNGFYAGKAYLYLGTAKSTQENVNEFIMPDAEISLGLTGSYAQSSARLGWRVAPAGDMNGDGYDDVAIVAANSGISGAEVFVLFGNPDPRSGAAIARDGKYADRKLDPLGNVPSLEWNNVYLERYAVCMQAEATRDHLGDGIGGGGDINGDGYDDLIIGAPNYADTNTDTGRVYVLWGRPNMLQINTRMNYNENAKEDTVHGPIKPAQDLLPLGDGGLIPEDSAYGFYIRNTTRADRFGGVILSNININGDIAVVTRNIFASTVTRNIPYSEVLIASTGYDQSRGKVDMYSYYKDQTGRYFKKITANDSILKGAYPGDMFGFSMTNLGDISADTNLGRSPQSVVGEDFAIGAPGSDGPDPINRPLYDVGSAYVFTAKPINNFDYRVTQSMFTYGQNQGNMFGYTVANVGNVDNDEYNNNDLAIASPFFKKGDKPNAGRVYIFATPLKNMGTDLSPSYKLIMDSFADFVAEGTNSGDMFGASICYIGDLDGDYVAEYIIGAPCLASTTNVDAGDYRGNIGRAFLFTNPDRVCPEVVDPMSYLRPIPGDRGAALVDTEIRYGKKMPVYNPVKFSLFDDRALDIQTAMIEIDPVGKRDTRKFIFVPPKGDERYYTIKNRKWTDFILNLKNNVYYETTYNIRIYARDTSDNPLKYNYGQVSNFYLSNLGYSGLGSSVAQRVPSYVANTLEPEVDIFYGQGDPNNKIIRNYFQYTFVTTANPFDGPNISLALKNPADEELYLHSNEARFLLTLADKKEGVASFSVQVTPNILGNKAGNTFVFGDAPNNLIAYPKKHSINEPIDIFDFPNGSKDGRFGIFITATDNAKPIPNVSTKNYIFFKDTLPPTINPVSPLAKAKNALIDGDIKFKVYDAGTGVSILDSYGNIDYSKIKIIINSSFGSVSANYQIQNNIDDNEILVTYNRNLVPEGYAQNIPEVLFTLKGLTFKYEEYVTLSVTVTDNAKHPVTYVYSYRVSPDYKPPVPGVDPIKIFESPYTTGNLTISVDAKDDVIIKRVMFTIEEDSGYSGLITLNSLSSATKNLYIDLGSQATANFKGKFSLFISGLAGHNPVDGPQTVKVYFFDAQGNRSSVAQATVILDSNSLNGGPIMPLAITALPSQTSIPLYQDMPIYINTPTINLYLYAWDPRTNPENTGIPAEVKGFVIEMDRSTNDNNGYLNRLLEFEATEWDSKTKRRYHKISNFRLDHLKTQYNYEGETFVTVNFIDYDGKLIEGLEDIYFFPVPNTQYISASDPRTGLSKYGENSADHPVNNIPLNAYAYPATNTMNHWCDQPFVFKFVYDITPPKLSKLFVKGGSTELFPAKTYTRDPKQLLLSMQYIDYQNPTVVNDSRYINPIEDMYYQIIAVSQNSPCLYADVQGTAVLPVTGTTSNWVITGKLKDYNGTLIPKGQMARIINISGYNFDGILTTENYQKVAGNQQQEYNSYDLEVSLERYHIDQINAVQNIYNVYDTGYQKALKALKESGITDYSYVGKHVSLITTGNSVLNKYYPDVAKLQANNYEYKKILAMRKAELKEADVGKANIFLKESATEGINSYQQAVFKKVEAQVRRPGQLDTEDDITTTNFLATATANWNYIDLRRNPYGKGLSSQIYPDTLALPVALTPNVQYYVRVCLKDKAGNYSSIMTSNCIALDLPIESFVPLKPVSRYAKNIHLNRNVFDIDFQDNQSGVSYVGFKTNANSSLYYNIGDDNFLKNNKDEIHSLSKFVTVNGYVYQEFNKYINGKWRMPDEVWNLLPEGEPINLYFKVHDGVNNVWEKPDAILEGFYKDTTKPVVNSTFPDAVTYGGKSFTASSKTRLNYLINGNSMLVITDQPIANVIAWDSIGYTPKLLVNKDFSFEQQGDSSITKPSYWKFNNSSDTFFKSTVESFESNTSINAKHYTGVYGMALQFSVLPWAGSGPQQYQWKGIATTINIPTSDMPVSYSIGVMMDSSLVTPGMSPGLLGTGTNEGGFGLKVQVGSTSIYSKGRLNEYQSTSGGQDWKLITANILIPPHPTTPYTITVNILHLLNGTNKSVTIDRQNGSISGTIRVGTGFMGKLLVDSLIIVPGNAVIDTRQGITQVNVYYSGQNNFSYYAYDDAGNAATGSMSVILDTTAPTWNGIPTVNRAHKASSILPNVTIKRKNNVDYVNAIQNNICYLAAKFLPIENESYITRYEYALCRINNGGLVETVNIEEVLPNNWDDPNATYRPLILDKRFDRVKKGSPYFFTARARNILQQWSAWTTSNALVIDIDAPTMSYQIAPSLQATANQGGHTVTWNTGWYTDDITVTVQARDVMWITTTNAIPGGAGVRYIYVVTNNAQFPARFSVSNLPENRVIVTFNLTAEGGNSFKVWAEDEFGYTSKYYTVTDNLYIDRQPPLVKTDLETILTSIPVVDNSKWQNSSKQFKIEFTDGLGDGTRKLYWKIDGEDMPPFTLDTSKIGNKLPATANIDGRDEKIQEGIWFGSFPKSLLATTPITTAEINTLVANRVLEKTTDTQGNEQYSWKYGATELDLINRLQELHIVHIAELVDIWRFNSTGFLKYYHTLNSNFFRVYKDGYHNIELYAVDKFGHASNTLVQRYLCLDQGRPDMLIDMGGAFQTVWSLHNITLNIEAFDMFKDPVLVTSSYYASGTPIPSALDGLEVRRPGSGVKKVGINLNSKGWIFFEPEPDDQDLNIQKADRFGFTINRGNQYIGNDYLVNDFIITQNGVNMFAYQVVDFASNGSEVAFCTNPLANRVWDETLNTYFYPGDVGVIRGVKIDTKPPYEGVLRITPASFTDIERLAGNYPLYTNKPEIVVSFNAKDDGIGVKYGVLTCWQNGSEKTSEIGLTNNINYDPWSYLTISKWVTINAIHPFVTDQLRHPVNNDQGIIDYRNAKKLVFGSVQGTRNFTIVYSDDFGFPYTQPAATVEQRSSTFNYAEYQAGLIKPINYVPMKIYEDNKYFTVNNGANSYFAWEGRFEIPTLNYGLGTRQVEEGSGYIPYANLTDGKLAEDDYLHYSYKDRNVNNMAIRIYFWNELLPQRTDHRGATANSQTIVYDNILRPTKYPSRIPEIRQALINKVTANFVSEPYVRLEFRHDETDELSGIHDVKITGAVKAAKNCATPNVWLPYYRNATNNFVLAVDTPAQDGWVTISVGAIRDRANNIIENITANTHVFNFFYDREIPKDNLDITKQTARVRLYHNGTGPQKGLNINGHAFIGCKDFKLEMDMFGANEYEVTERLNNGLENSIISGNYRDLPDLDADTKTVTFSFSAGNRTDGTKTLFVKFFDRGWTGNMANSPRSSFKVITYNMVVDSTKPTVNVSGLDLNKFYSPHVSFDLVMDERSAQADVISGIKSIEWQINNQPVQTKIYNIISLKMATLNIFINNTSTANRVRYKVTDYIGNSYDWQEIRGIKVNANPPQLYLVMEANSNSGVYINKITPNIAIGAIGTNRIAIFGDALPTTRSYNPTKTIRVGASTRLVDILPVNMLSGDGPKNITIDARDSYSDAGGPHDAKRYTFYLDTQKPTMSVDTVLPRNINVIPHNMYITGHKEDIEKDGYFSGCDVEAYIGFSNNKILAESIDANHWRMKMTDVIRIMGPGYYGLRFYAIDKATNKSVERVITFNVASRYITGGEISNLASLDINGVQTNDQRLERANKEISGVHSVPGLEDTITEFNAKDSGNNDIHDFNSTEDVKLVIQYNQDSGNKGNPENFRIYYLNETTGQWELVPGEQKVDKEKRTVEATIEHFSIYRIMQSVGYASNLKDVHVYPNPYKPNDDDLGNGDDNDSRYNHIIFENITSTAKIRLYTISGELINTIENKTNQAIYWYADNMRGQKVASGVYIYIITDDDGNKKIGRVTIVR